VLVVIVYPMAALKAAAAQVLQAGAASGGGVTW
jgi:hypothetical protein